MCFLSKPLKRRLKACLQPPQFGKISSTAPEEAPECLPPANPIWKSYLFSEAPEKTPGCLPPAKTNLENLPFSKAPEEAPGGLPWAKPVWELGPIITQSDLNKK